MYSSLGDFRHICCPPEITERSLGDSRKLDFLVCVCSGTQEISCPYIHGSTEIAAVLLPGAEYADIVGNVCTNFSAALYRT